MSPYSENSKLDSKTSQTMLSGLEVFIDMPFLCRGEGSSIAKVANIWACHSGLSRQVVLVYRWSSRLHGTSS